ncbi:hypothetical protein HCAG_06974 [Histoplasma mississippiense (nom. inval.)]|uniref:hypothetical protein n=1 Tax=Ajellomyces capsulatus (strain NAm1 / WU24) TaxID=2059318 RepID=UPI000157CB45|nr:hypothetical protein HCAG_06974 [Histoplasma mississippiense (nom. inval.)]EDN09807.1 hypothetical protein HCAG_06974 [Histoplasma mississippiense (nom. inval.)]
MSEAEQPTNTPRSVIAESAPAVSASANRREIRLADPPAYYGSNLHEYNIFIRALERIYKLNPTQYDTDEVKIVYASVARIQAVYKGHTRRSNNKQESFSQNRENDNKRGTKRYSDGSPSKAQRNLTSAGKLTIEERQHHGRFRMYITIQLDTPSGPEPIRCLVDSGADFNYISHTYATSKGWKRIGPPSQVQYPDGRRGYRYGIVNATQRATDGLGETRESKLSFHSVNLADEDLYLGLPWLRTVNPLIDWKALSWRHRIGDTRIEIAEPEEFIRSMQETSTTPLYFWDGNTESSSERLCSINETTLPQNLQDLLTEFKDIFSAEAAAKLDENPIISHHIRLQDGKEPPYGPLYNLSIAELDALRKYLEEMLSRQWVRPTKSPAAAPIVFAKKKDGTLRLCVDYRGLNKITIKDRYPIPRIEEMLDRLQNAIIFSKIDLRDAYYRIRIAEGDEWKTAFRTRYGSYEFRVMPMGLCNAPATFQSYINEVLKGLVDICCIVYLDDILIYSQNTEDHTKHLRLIFERLRKYRLYAKESKCTFFTTEVEFLGYIVSPTARKAFVNLKETFAQAVLLVHYDPRKETQVETDASKDGIAGILSQRLESPPETYQEAMKIASERSQNICNSVPTRRKEWRPIAFFSQKLSGASRNYDTHDLELLAIVASFRHWRHYLQGNPYPIQVITDHDNLKYFLCNKSLNNRQAHWGEELSAYDFYVVYRPGRLNPADPPSRRPDYVISPGDERDAFTVARSQEVENSAEPGILREASDTSGDPSIIWRVDEDRGLLHRNHAIYVPPSKAITQELLRIHHDDPWAGHFGIARTLELLRRKYYWNTLRKGVETYVRECDICQHVKAKRHKPYGQLAKIPVPTRPFSSLAMDFIVGLPTNTILSDYGSPSSIISDRDKLFTSHYWSTFCYYLRVKRNLSTAFHPQTDGQTERQNQTLENYLRAYSNYHQDNWVDLLPQAQFAYNSVSQASIGMPPFRALLGYDPVPPRGVIDKESESATSVDLEPLATARVEKLQEIQSKLQVTVRKSFEKQAEYYNRRHQDKTFAIGDPVLLSSLNIATSRPCRKLEDKWFGPFTILNTIGSQAYRLDLPRTFGSMHPVFHVTLLEPYYQRPGEEPKKPPGILLEGRTEYFVEAILDKRLHRNKEQYLVKWEGYPNTENTWEPPENLLNSRNLLEEYEKVNRNRPLVKKKRSRIRH